MHRGGVAESSFRGQFEHLVDPCVEGGEPSGDGNVRATFAALRDVATLDHERACSSDG